MPKNRGKVFIVGAGPGHPELITLRAKTVLGMADVVLYDNLVSKILLDFCKRTATKIFVGKSAGKSTLSQTEINDLLVQYASQGLKVVRLKGGDPLIFGRGSEEAQFVAEKGFDFEIIPGISSSIGASAFAGIPLTHRGIVTGVIFITAHEDPTKEKPQVDWKWLANASNATIVIYMVANNLHKVVSTLIKNGMSPLTLSSAVENATLPTQKVICSELANLPEEIKKNGLASPLLVIISPNVPFRDVLNWFEKKPLFGKKIVITRPLNQNSTLYFKLLDEGADPIPFDLVETILRKKVSIRKLFDNDYDWIIFSSENGVRFFFASLELNRLDFRVLGNSRIAALGEKTAQQLRAFHINPDFVPSRYDSSTFLKEFVNSFDIEKARILRVKGNFTNDPISQELSKLCNKFVTLEVYDIHPRKISIEEETNIIQSNPDGIIFTASLIVERFFEVFGKEIALQFLNRTDVFSIGPMTQRKLIEYGVNKVVTSKVHTIEGIVETIKKHYNRGKL